MGLERGKTVGESSCMCGGKENEGPQWWVLFSFLLKEDTKD